MSSCADCGRAAPPRASACDHCGGHSFSKPIRKGAFWTMAAAGSVAVGLAILPIRAALGRRRSRRGRKDAEGGAP